MKSDQMGTGHNNPSPRELPLSNQARFSSAVPQASMTGSAPRTDCLLSVPEFFALATARLTLDVPEGRTDPNVIPGYDDPDADPAVMAPMAAAPPSRTAAVLVPIVARAEPTVLCTGRNARLADH